VRSSIKAATQKFKSRVRAVGVPRVSSRSEQADNLLWLDSQMMPMLVQAVSVTHVCDPGVSVKKIELNSDPSVDMQP
jgi:hypothetical protein